MLPLSRLLSTLTSATTDDFLTRAFPGSHPVLDLFFPPGSRRKWVFNIDVVAMARGNPSHRRNFSTPTGPSSPSSSFSLSRSSSRSHSRPRMSFFRTFWAAVKAKPNSAEPAPAAASPQNPSTTVLVVGAGMFFFPLYLNFLISTCINIDTSLYIYIKSCTSKNTDCLGSTGLALAQGLKKVTAVCLLFPPCVGMFTSKRRRLTLYLSV